MNIFVELPSTRKKIELKRQRGETMVRTLKGQLELIAGIPFQVQRLQYLDCEDLRDDAYLKQCSIVHHATLKLRVWEYWEDLVHAVLEEQVARVVEIVKNDEDKFDIALFVASSWDIGAIIRALIGLRKHADGQTAFGRTALHAAAVKGNCDLIETLVEAGANINVKDSFGKKPLQIAKEFRNKDGERLLFLLHWKERTAKVPCWKDKTGLMMHQMYDSGYPTWRRGEYAQMYMSLSLPHIKKNRLLEKQSTVKLNPVDKQLSQRLQSLAEGEETKCSEEYFRRTERKEKLLPKFAPGQDETTKSKVQRSFSPVGSSSVKHPVSASYRALSGKDRKQVAYKERGKVAEKDDRPSHTKVLAQSGVVQKEEPVKRKVPLYEDWKYVPSLTRMILSNEDSETLLS